MFQEVESFSDADGDGESMGNMLGIGCIAGHGDIGSIGDNIGLETTSVGYVKGDHR